MKYLLLTISFLLLFSCKKKDTGTDPEDKVCIPTSLEDNLIAYYPFIEGSLEDFKNNNDLTNANNAELTEGREGSENCAIWFSDRMPNYLYMENPIFLYNLRKYSISLWYKHVINNEGQYELLIGRGNLDNQFPASEKYMSIGVYDINKVTFFNNLSSVWDNSDDNLLNEWYHVVATCDFDSKTMSLYQNGKLMETRTSTTLDIINPIQGGYLIIGKYFNGAIDDIAIFNKVLSQEEVLEMYSIESCCN